MWRSKQKITKRDLRKLLRLAGEDIDNFFDGKPIYKKPYHGKVKLVALCQGAATSSAFRSARLRTVPVFPGLYNGD